MGCCPPTSPTQHKLLVLDGDLAGLVCLIAVLGQGTEPSLVDFHLLSLIQPTFREGFAQGWVAGGKCGRHLLIWDLEKKVLLMATCSPHGQTAQARVVQWHVLEISLEQW